MKTNKKINSKGFSNWGIRVTIPQIMREKSSRIILKHYILVGILVLVHIYNHCILRLYKNLCLYKKMKFYSIMTMFFYYFKQLIDLPERCTGKKCLLDPTLKAFLQD